MTINNMIKQHKGEPNMTEEMKLWKIYEVELRVLRRLYGGLPKNPDIIQGFLKGKGVPEDDESKRLAEKIKKEVGTTEEELEEAEERMWTTFKRDERGLFIETRQIKAMLKEAVGETEMYKQPGLMGLKSRVGGSVFPKGQGGEDLTRLYLYRGSEMDKIVHKPDGFEETVGHVRGPQGPRSILKRKDYVTAPWIMFELKVANKRVKKKVLDDLFEVGEEIGLGADRSQEHGKFKLVKFEEIKDE